VAPDDPARRRSCRLGPDRRLFERYPRRARTGHPAAAATPAADAAARLQAGTGSAADAARAVEAARRAAVEAARAEARAALAVEDLRLAAGLPLFAPPEGR